ncbi:B12-binding domain-containing radical SAM protein [Acetivibrio mesophilus]|nr:radical SAM protein [Acetivibrio mesophilus]HHV28125.1 B12-binding domain-containing radical SAM protein [Clostridium sp.]
MRERKRVACVIPPFYRLIESKNNRLSPAMHYVAETLKLRGHEVVFINGDFADDSVDYAERLSMTLNSWLFAERYKNGHESFEEVIQILVNFKPDIVFIGAGDVLMPTVEMGSTQSCAYIAKRIKETLGKDSIVCVGYGHLLKYAKKCDLEDLDVVITGEGEEQAIEVVEKGLRGKLPSKWCQDMDSLPILTGDYIFHEYKPEDWDYIMSMRGCPNRCTFCHQPSLRGFNVSTMSPERFVRELRYRIEKIGTKGFYFSDMIFAPGTGPRTIEMINRLIALKNDYPDFSWWAEARVDTITKREIVENMKRSGCRHLKFGVEMANQEMLNVVKKGINLKEVENAFKISAECGIERTAYVLLGCPGFNDEDYKKMWQFFYDLKADNYVININVPYLGTELHEQIKDRLIDFNLYKDGEESFIHTSLVMKEFWNISDETLNMYFSLQGKKDDSDFRKYKKKIVDKEQYMKNRQIVYM